jgi:hypothetical protein
MVVEVVVEVVVDVEVVVVSIGAIALLALAQRKPFADLTH